jgi:hypothetical protein
LKPAHQRPPLVTLLVEVLWTMDRSAGIPKSQRFTFGRTVDRLTIDVVPRATRAAFTAEKKVKAGGRAELGLLSEQPNLLWELVERRGWISQQQLIFVTSKLAKAGRMMGGWLKQVHGRSDDSPPTGQGLQPRKHSEPGQPL